MSPILEPMRTNTVAEETPSSRATQATGARVPCSRNTLRAARVICASVTTRLRATGVLDPPRLRRGARLLLLGRLLRLIEQLHDRHRCGIAGAKAGLQN